MTLKSDKDSLEELKKFEGYKVQIYNLQTFAQALWTLQYTASKATRVEIRLSICPHSSIGTKNFFFSKKLIYFMFF